MSLEFYGVYAPLALGLCEGANRICGGERMFLPERVRLLLLLLRSGLSRLRQLNVWDALYLPRGEWIPCVLGRVGCAIKGLM